MSCWSNSSSSFWRREKRYIHYKDYPKVNVIPTRVSYERNGLSYFKTLGVQNLMAYKKDSVHGGTMSVPPVKVRLG